MRITALIVLATIACVPGAAMARCGEHHGHPGYRLPTGECVSWRQFNAGMCGNPPTTSCTPEDTSASDGKAMAAPKNGH